MNQLIFDNGSLLQTTEKLLSSELETAAIILSEPVLTPAGDWRLLTNAVIEVPESAYLVRTHAHIELAPVFLAEIIKKARLSKRSVVMAHTHPFDGAVHASPIDSAGESKWLPTLFRRIPGLPHGRMIFGPGGYDARLWVGNMNEGKPLEVIDVGSKVLRLPRTPHQQELGARFDRQVRAFGRDGQDTIEAMRIGIVGLGGTGSIIAQELAHLGVKYFTLIDHDTIDQSNLNRVVGATHDDVGRSKVSTCADFIRKIQPSAKVKSLQRSILFNSVARELLDTDFFFCCTDSHGSRAVLAQLSYQYFIPAIDVGLRITVVEGQVTHITGRVQMYAPGLACVVCSHVLDPEEVRRDFLTDEERKADPYIVGSAAPQPAIISINSVVASLGVTMFLGAVTDIPIASRYQIYRAESGLVRDVMSEQQQDCLVCSSRGAYGRGNSWDLPGRTHEG